MDPNTDILFDYSPFFRIFKDRHVERFPASEINIPPSLDPTTGVLSKDVTIDPTTSITARLYLPPVATTTTKKLPILVYFHGGAFCFMSASSPPYHSFLNALSSRAHLLVLSVNYRLAPENPLPAAYDDSWAALKWSISNNNNNNNNNSPDSDSSWLDEHADFNRVFVAGDSAGANIAHRMAMNAGAEKVTKIEGMVLVHPFFWGREAVGAETREEVKRRIAEGLWRVVNLPGVGVDIDHPWINPMKDERFGRLGCARVLVCVAERDGLVERGRAYCEELRRRAWSGEVELFLSEGMEHCFHIKNPGACPMAVQELLERLVAFFMKR